MTTRNAEYLARRREELREAGRCTWCGCVNGDGFRLCLECRDKNRARKAQQRQRGRERRERARAGQPPPPPFLLPEFPMVLIPSEYSPEDQDDASEFEFKGGE